MTRAPLTIMAVLAALLMGVWWLTDGRAESPPAPERVAPVDVIAKRVEALRGLRFDSLPRPVEVTPEQARREGLEDLDRSYPEARRRADEQVLKLLGLIDASVDLREVSASVFSEGVAGYYDPRTKRMRTVRGAATGTKVLAEMVLAHELTHALEDQRYGLGLEDQSGSDDAALARLALVEGTASDLMYAYARRHFTAEETLGGVLGSAFAPTGSLPAFLQAQLVFPYTGGAEFVAALRERAGGRWTLVDLAERSRPPASTEQVMHPEKWVRVEPPVRVRVRAGEALGRRLGARGGRRAGRVPDARAARRRGRRRLLRGRGGLGRGPLRALAPRRRREPPRRGADRALALGHPGRRAGVRGQAAPVGRDGLGATAQEGGTFGIDAGHVAVAARDGAVTLAMAPDGPSAQRLAAAG